MSTPLSACAVLTDIIGMYLVFKIKFYLYRSIFARAKQIQNSVEEIVLLFAGFFVFWLAKNSNQTE